MSVNESTESTDAVYRTPGAAEEEALHDELEPAVERDLGASPELEGPVTRSGRKRKNTAPVKSSGKKKNKTMTSRTPPKSDTNPPPAQAPKAGGQVPPAGGDTRAGTDLASLLTQGLSSIQTSMAAMEQRLGGKMDSLEANVKKNKDSISILTSSVNKNTVDLARLESQMRDGEDRFEDRVAGIVRSVMGRDSSTAMNQSRAPSAEQVDRYERCRRSLRLWPIGGPDLEGSVVAFLTNKLNLPPAQVEDFGPLSVRRIVEPRSKIESEALVEFVSSSIRDTVKSMGYRLEGQKAGIRIEIPNFLKSDFHVLQNLSYRLKLSNKEMKRSVKFDEDNYGLMLDVQLPGQDWTRIRPDQARAARAVDPSLRTGPRELSLDMIAGAIRSQDRSGDSLSGSNALPLGRRAE